MLVRFWGVRGTVPWATPASIGFGCNTPCVEVRDDRIGAYLVLDAGSGLVGLSGTFSGEPRSTPVLLSHYHWDHTQGLPFFGRSTRRAGRPRSTRPTCRTVPHEWVHTMFGPPNFPVPFADAAEPSGDDAALRHCPLEIGGFTGLRAAAHAPRRSVRVPHSRQPTGDLCYVTDHEFGDPDVDAQLAAFCRNCAAVIADAHFTPEELPRHAGWGHSSWRQVAEFAATSGAGISGCFITSPDAQMTDLRRFEAEARRVFPATMRRREGLAFEI